MPVRIVIFHPLAVKEYRSALRWYAERSPQAARRFVAALDRVIERLEENPEAGAIFQEPFRWMKVRRFPYVLYYESLTPGLVWVYAVAHGRRRPGYWRKRKQD